MYLFSWHKYSQRNADGKWFLSLVGSRVIFTVLLVSINVYSFFFLHYSCLTQLLKLVFTAGLCKISSFSQWLEYRYEQVGAVSYTDHLHSKQIFDLRVQKILYYCVEDIFWSTLRTMKLWYSIHKACPILSSFTISVTFTIFIVNAWHLFLTFPSSSLPFYSIPSSVSSIALDIQHFLELFTLTSGECYHAIMVYKGWIQSSGNTAVTWRMCVGWHYCHLYLIAEVQLK
jgi:hypothetical protein